MAGRLLVLKCGISPYLMLSAQFFAREELERGGPTFGILPHYRSGNLSLRLGDMPEIFPACAKAGISALPAAQVKPYSPASPKSTG